MTVTSPVLTAHFDYPGSPPCSLGARDRPIASADTLEAARIHGLEPATDAIGRHGGGATGKALRRRRLA